jgi:hypothetical protein
MFIFIKFQCLKVTYSKNKLKKNSFIQKSYFSEKRHVVLIKVMLVIPLNAF